VLYDCNRGARYMRASGVPKHPSHRSS